MNRACYPKEKHQNSHKNGREIHMNVSFRPFLPLVWFAGATPEIVAETDTDENCFGRNFSWQMQRQLFFAAWRGQHRQFILEIILSS